MMTLLFVGVGVDETSNVQMTKVICDIGGVVGVVGEIN